MAVALLSVVVLALTGIVWWSTNLVIGGFNVSRALAEAKGLQHEPSEAAALFGLARVDGAKGDRARAEARLTEAMTKWLASGDEFMAADAALELMEYASADRSDPAERRRWAKVAEGLGKKPFRNSVELFLDPYYYGPCLNTTSKI